MAEKAKAKRPWGRWSVLVRGEGYKVKQIEVLPGKRLSLQKHHQRSEHWTIVAGTARVVLGRKSFTLKPNQSLYVGKGHLHRLANPGPGLLKIIEVQVGPYLGEDDIVRVDDDYGRAKRKLATKR